MKQEPVLRRGHVEHPITPPRPADDLVEQQITVPQHGPRSRVRPVAQKHLHAGQQLRAPARLGDVVLDLGAEHGYQSPQKLACGKAQDRRAVGEDRTITGEGVNIGDLHVDHDQIDVMLPEQSQRGGAGRGRGDQIAREAQLGRERTTQIRVRRHHEQAEIVRRPRCLADAHGADLTLQ
ncbi:hypothetical protein OG470_16700 [Micromonospora sp. NBC_00389]